MLLIAENIPATSEMVPLIGIYLTVTMSLTSMSIVLTVVVLQLHHAGPFSPVLSRSFYNFMTQKVAYVVCMTDTVRRHETNKLKHEIERNSMRKSKIKENNLDKILSRNQKDINEIKSKLDLNLRKSFNRNDACSCCRLKASGQTSNIQVEINLDSDSQTPGNENEKHCFLDKNQDQIKRSMTADVYEDLFEISRSRCLTLNQQFFNSQNCQTSTENVSSIKTAPLKSFTYSSAHKVNYSPRHETSISTPETPCMKQCKCYLYSNRNKRGQHEKDLIETVEIFSKNLKEYLSRQDQDTERSCSQNEWKLIALVVDRVLFWTFFILTFVSTIFLLIIVPILKNRNFITPYMYSGEITNFFQS